MNNAISETRITTFVNRCTKAYMAVTGTLALIAARRFDVLLINLLDTAEAYQETHDLSNPKCPPERIWDMFLKELNRLFNKENITLDYALQSACAIIAVKSKGIYVLDNDQFNEFSYHEIIIEKVQRKYLQYFEKFFNEAAHDIHEAKLLATKATIEELHLLDSEFIELYKIYEFDESKVINAV